MIFTPASTSRSATAWAASAGTARTPTTISCSATTDSSSPKSRTCRSPTSLADDVRVDVEHGDDLEAVVGEDVGAGDRLAEVAGAEEGDVVLAGGPQDLADLGDQRLDVVADAALAELAEAREVAADLRRVDVGVVRQFLRRDRLAAHLAGLGEDLQVAREARRDAERKPLAVDDQPVGHLDAPRLVSSIHLCAHGPTVSSRATSAARSRTKLGDDHTVDLDHRDALEHAPQQQRRRSRCRPRAARSGSPRSAGRRSPASASSQRWQPGPRRRPSRRSRVAHATALAFVGKAS